MQITLNPIIWDRQRSHIFKLSAEKYGAVSVDNLKATAEASRELREIDCGQFYLNLTAGANRQFARELLAIRLKLSGYDGTPEEIIGKSKYEAGSLGKALRAKKEKRGRINNQYHGLGTIANICSGDISTLLEIYRRIFEKGQVDRRTKLTVGSNLQHEAIESVSRELLNIIKNYVPYGMEMHNIVHWFGNLSRRILQDGYLQRKGGSEIPCETSRIEIDNPPNQTREELTSEQQSIMDELVRRTIFIEMESGRSRHKYTPSLRLQLRRIFCPTFQSS